MKKTLKNLADKALTLTKKTLQALLNTFVLTLEMAVLLGFLAVFTLFAVKAPELHGQWIRSKVGAKSYIVYERNAGMGSGFAIVAPSGNTYIVTNDHVCRLSKDNQTILIKDQEGNSMRRRIIARSEYSDLCLVEGKPGVEGLTLGAPPSVGQIIAAVGHPAGYDLTLSRGEVIMREDVVIPVGPISAIDMRTGEEHLIPTDDGGVSEEECSLPKNRIGVDTFTLGGIFLIKLKMCYVVTEGANFTNMAIQPGSSGSPVVNFWGNVVGVVFAGDRSMWGIFVSHEDLRAFLSNY